MTTPNRWRSAGLVSVADVGLVIVLWLLWARP